MIAIILYAQDGKGGWTLHGGYTDHDQSVTVDGVTCAKGGIVSLSDISNSADFSRAQGALCEAPEFEFSLADSNGASRLSAAFFDGSLRFFGWRVRLFNSRTASGFAEIPGDWRIYGVDTSEESMDFRCIQAWGLDHTLIGQGKGGSEVGLAVGQHLVYTSAASIAAPSVVTREVSTGRFTGVPGASTVASSYSDTADAKSHSSSTGYRYIFGCIDEDEGLRVLALAQAGVIAGKTYAEIPSLAYFSPSTTYRRPGESTNTTGPAVIVETSEGFYLSEAFGDVKIQTRDTKIPIAAGTQNVVGFVVGDRVSIPVSEVEIDASTGIATVSPLILSPTGFVSLTRVDRAVQFYPNATAPGAGLTYYGSVESINGDNTGDPPAFATLDASLVPTDPVNGVAMHLDGTGVGLEYKIPLHLSVLPSVEGDFSAWLVDVRWRLTTYTPNATAPSSRAIYMDELYSTAPAREFVYKTAATHVEEQDVAGWQRYNYLTRFDSVSALQTFGKILLDTTYFGEEQAFLQVTDAVLYGISDLDLSSASAAIVPGQSAYANSEQGVTEAAESILSSMGAPVSGYSVEPSGAVAASFTGRFLPADTRRMDCVAEIAQEMWLALSPNSAGFDLSGASELVEVPGVPLGAIEDIVTEPVIEYAYNGSEYTKKAYIANVDKEWDWAKASEFRGGWGSRDNGYTSIDMGYYIWQLCRKAYLRHGVKRSETISMPSLHEDEAVGRAWFDASRNGARRIEWLCNPPRFARFSIVESAGARLWAGCQVTIHGQMAGYAGYDVSAWATDPVLVTEVSRNVQDMAATVTVMLPPVVTYAPTNRIVQTFTATDRIVQSFDASNRIIQEI